jgi:RimJ/RimL family protein N-acetyltransferase
MTLETLHPRHLPALYDVSSTVDFWANRTISEFMDAFSKYDGWAIVKDNKAVGYIVLCNHTPYLDIMIHCSVLPEYKSVWLTRKIYAQVFNHIFRTLNLPRCTSWAVAGSDGDSFLPRLGFQKEGTIRKGIFFNGQFHNVNTYSMLPEEQRWR